MSSATHHALRDPAALVKEMARVHKVWRAICSSEQVIEAHRGTQKVNLDRALLKTIFLEDENG